MTVKVVLEGKKDDELPPMQDKSAVVMIGRFQPFQKGHLAILNAAKKAFRKHKYDKVILCIIEGKQSSKDKKKNPLTGKQRKYYIEQSEASVGVDIIIASNVFDAFVKCREAGYEPMCVVGGKFTGDDKEDRAKAYKGILDKYFTTPDGKEINHRAVTLSRNKNSEKVDGISGTMVRHAVKMDLYDDFKDMVPFTDENVVKKLWNDLKEANE